MEIRVAVEEDASGIQKIYAPYVEKTTITFEYDIPTVEEMRSRIEKTLKQYPYLVAIKDQNIIGYAYASVFKGRTAYDWACELSIYIDENHQHEGIGKILYQQLFEILKLMNMQVVYACITHPNEKSERFHELFGFEQVAHFHKCGFKFQQWQDVIWMEKRIQNDICPLSLIPFSQLPKEQIDECIKKIYVHS